MKQSILYTWNNVLIDLYPGLKQESWPWRAEGQTLRWHANGLNYTKERQSLHLTENIRDVTLL